jgi:hypothetical protein
MNAGRPGARPAHRARAAAAAWPELHWHSKGQGSGAPHPRRPITPPSAAPAARRQTWPQLEQFRYSAPVAPCDGRALLRGTNTKAPRAARSTRQTRCTPYASGWSGAQCVCVCGCGWVGAVWCGCANRHAGAPPLAAAAAPAAVSGLHSPGAARCQGRRGLPGCPSQRAKVHYVLPRGQKRPWAPGPAAGPRGTGLLDTYSPGGSGGAT